MSTTGYVSPFYSGHRLEPKEVGHLHFIVISLMYFRLFSCIFIFQTLMKCGWSYFWFVADWRALRPGSTQAARSKKMTFSNLVCYTFKFRFLHFRSWFVTLSKLYSLLPFENYLFRFQHSWRLVHSPSTNWRVITREVSMLKPLLLGRRVLGWMLPLSIL